jgi:hypothetical protein
MRTTIVIDDDLFRQAKHQAAETGQSLSQLIMSALREALRPAKPKKEPRYRVITFDGGGKKHHLSPADMKRILEEEDIERYGRR